MGSNRARADVARRSKGRFHAKRHVEHQYGTISGSIAQPSLVGFRSPHKFSRGDLIFQGSMHSINRGCESVYCVVEKHQRPIFPSAEAFICKEKTTFVPAPVAL